MTTLLSSYSITQIILFIVVFSLAIKGVIDFLDWAKGKMKVAYDKKKTEEDSEKTVTERIDNLESSIKDIADSVSKVTDKVDLLLESDKDAIKAYITREHHYFCYQKEWIDDYSLDCLERRYDHYIEEHGNSFIEQLMNEVRALPKKPLDS